MGDSYEMFESKQSLTIHLASFSKTGLLPLMKINRCNNCKICVILNATYNRAKRGEVFSSGMIVFFQPNNLNSTLIANGKRELSIIFK
jgi:hypothetical protein